MTKESVEKIAEWLQDALSIARQSAASEAFRAGAEAMREAAVDAAIESGRCLDALGRSVIASGHHKAASAILALPLPAHQSSTHTGTNATTGHS